MSEFGRFPQGQLVVPPGQFTAGVGTATFPLYRSRGWERSVFGIVATLNSGAGNLTVYIDDGPDKVNFGPWVELPTLAASGYEVAVPTRASFAYSRLRYVITGTANYTVIPYEAGNGV